MYLNKTLLMLGLLAALSGCSDAPAPVKKDQARISEEVPLAVYIPEIKEKPSEMPPLLTIKTAVADYILSKSPPNPGAYASELKSTVAQLVQLEANCLKGGLPQEVVCTTGLDGKTVYLSFIKTEGGWSLLGLDSR